MLLLPLKDIFPFKITDNVPNDPSRGYDFETTYGEHELVNDGDWVYESVDADNLNNTPNASPLKWNKTRIVNQHAYTDRTTSMQSQSIDDLHFEYTLNNDTFIMLTGLVGSLVKIKIEDINDSSIVYYDEEYPLSFSESSMDWYSWMNPSLQPTIYKDKITMNIEPRYNQRLIIDIVKDESRGGSAISNLIFGVPIDVGCTIMGVKRGLKSSSKIETVDGVKNVIEREGYDTLDVDVFVEDNDRNNTIYSTLQEYIDTPVVAIGSTSDEMYQIYGIFNDIDYAIDYSATYTISMSSLELNRKKSEPMKRLHGGTLLINSMDMMNKYFSEMYTNDLQYYATKGFFVSSDDASLVTDKIMSFSSCEITLTTVGGNGNRGASMLKYGKNNITTTFVRFAQYDDTNRFLEIDGKLVDTTLNSYTHKHTIYMKNTFLADKIFILLGKENLKQYINNITFTECIFR